MQRMLLWCTLNQVSEMICRLVDAIILDDDDTLYVSEPMAEDDIEVK